MAKCRCGRDLNTKGSKWSQCPTCLLFIHEKRRKDGRKKLTFHKVLPDGISFKGEIPHAELVKRSTTNRNKSTIKREKKKNNNI